MDLEKILNKGVVRLGHPTRPPPKTVVVLGVGRGGTSMCAGALNKLGLFLGEQADTPTFEDLSLYYAHAEQDWGRIGAIIERYNEEHLSWGCKLPSIIPSLERFHQALRSPVYLVVFRDLLAIAQRAKVSAAEDPVETMSHALGNYSAILNFLREAEPDAVLCSYEKALQFKKSFVQALVEMLGGSSDVASRSDEAIDFISTRPVDYLSQTCFTADIGYLDGVETTKATGWAKEGDSNGSAELALFVNGIELTRFRANSFREDLLAKRLHPTGRCGFEVDLDAPLKPGDLVSVRFAKTSDELRGSPQRFLPYAPTQNP